MPLSLRELTPFLDNLRVHRWVFRETADQRASFNSSLGPWPQEGALRIQCKYLSLAKPGSPVPHKAVSVLCAPRSHRAHYSLTRCHLSLFVAKILHETIAISLGQTLMWFAISFSVFLPCFATRHHDFDTMQSQKLCFFLHWSLFFEIPVSELLCLKVKLWAALENLIPFHLFLSPSL